MINVVQEIVDKLRTVYPSAQYDIYTERIEQGFSAPCFSIRQLRADVTPYPSGLHEIVQHMDVRFFPSSAGAVPRDRTDAHAAAAAHGEPAREQSLVGNYRRGAAFLRGLPAVCPGSPGRYSDGEFADHRRNGGLTMAVKRKTEAGAPAFTGAQLLTFDRYRERRDLLGVLLDKDQRYTFSEVDALIDNFMKGKVN